MIRKKILKEKFTLDTQNCYGSTSNNLKGKRWKE